VHTQKKTKKATKKPKKTKKNQKKKVFFNTTFISMWFQTLSCIKTTAEHESSTQVVLKSTFW